MTCVPIYCTFLIMNNTMNDEAISRRLREYQSDLCEMVRAGDLTETQANEWFNDVADRLNRDGAWG